MADHLGGAGRLVRAGPVKQGATGVGAAVCAACHIARVPPFSPSVRRRCGSQVGQNVLRQNAAVRRYVPRVIRTTRAQQSTQFPGIPRDVLAPLHIMSAYDPLLTLPFVFATQPYFDAYLLRDRRRPGLLITLQHVEILFLRITGGKGYTTTSSANFPLSWPPVSSGASRPKVLR